MFETKCLFVNTYVHVVDRMCVTIHTRNEKKKSTSIVRSRSVLYTYTFPISSNKRFTLFHHSNYDDYYGISFFFTFLIIIIL
jgi:hypothetical protein